MPLPSQNPDAIIELGNISIPGVYAATDAGWNPREATSISSGGSTTPTEPDPGATITCAITEGPAGDDDDNTARSYSASVAERAGGNYTWTITNGYILSGQGTNRILFALGESMQDCTIACTVRNVVTGIVKRSTSTINVLPYPRTAHIETGMILGNGVATGTITMSERFTIDRVTASGLARLRLYKTAAARLADLNRLMGTDPEEGHGQVLEIITTPQKMDILLDPRAEGSNGDSPQQKTIYWAVTNRLAIAVQSLAFDIAYIQEI